MAFPKLMCICNLTPLNNMDNFLTDYEIRKFNLNNKWR